MMIRSVIIASATAALSCWLPDETRAQTSTGSSVSGAWRVVEVTRDSAGTRIARPSQPGFVIFTQRHYSITRVDSPTPRRDFPSELRRTADTYLEIWGPFIGQAGTYEITGNRLTVRPQVAKNPAGMLATSFTTHIWRAAADTLWLQQVASESGAIRDGAVLKLVRAER